MDSSAWDQRYSEHDLVWSAGPNLFVEEVAADLPAGRALDLAAGEGRNALWLAEKGWTVTAVDFSSVALARARSLAGQRLGDHADRVETVEADLRHYVPDPAAYDLVLVIYLQVPEPLRTRALRHAAAAVAPGGSLLVVAHHSDNPTRGHGGPQDPSVLYTAEDAASAIRDTGLRVTRAETRTRTVNTDDGLRTALDAFLLAVRP